MEKQKYYLTEMLIEFRRMVQMGFITTLGEEWIEKSKKEEIKLKDVEMTSYYGELNYPNMAKEVEVLSPYFSPISFILEEGVFIIISEERYDKDEEENTKGEKIELSNKLAEEFLQGNWFLQQRSDQESYEDVTPQICINVDKLICSIEETEIEAERFLFSGQIEIDGIIYDSYTELDPVNMFAYPIRIISILKEKGIDYKLEIWLEDIDQDLELFIESDLNEVYERAIAADIYYQGIDGEYLTAENKVDYLIKD